MAIVTAGYDGTVDEVQFAEVLYRYSVVGPDDFKATTQAGDRIVAIADGVALGPGTRDVATAIPNIQFAAASGTRWDLVVLRRDWQPPGGATTVTIVQGGSTKGYPVVGTAATDWNRRPGIMDDQPLYLQEVNGTSLGTRIDLRCWAGHGGLTAVSEDVKTYLGRVGAQVLINGVEWTYALGDNNVPSWRSAFQFSAPYAMAAGLGSATVGNVSSSTFAITFPAGRFSTPPIVTLGKAMSTNQRLVFAATNVTASGFNMIVQDVNLNAISMAVACFWQAVQMTPTSGAG